MIYRYNITKEVKMTLVNYKEEVIKLNKHRISYEKGKSTITDKEYDVRLRRLKEFEENNIDKIDSKSPTQVVGNVKGSNRRYKHLYPMYSMKDGFTKEEIVKWLSITNCKEYISTPKFDGISLNILYINGRRVFGATRGDGINGENVTSKLDFILNIPSTIPIMTPVEIRGEVVMTREIFNKLNDTGYEFKNPRNATAGTMGLLDIEEFRKRELRFLAWDMKGEDIDCRTYSEVLDKIWSFGFKRYDKVLVTSIEHIEEKYQYYDSRQEAFKIDYDGLVIRVNDLEQFEDLGVAGKYPKGLIAYKFSTMELISKVTNIITQVGRTGVLTPVAEIEPVDIEGSIVSRATLHNWNEIDNLGISIGATILITKSGGVIPKILTVIEGSDIKVQIPNRCPMCLNKLLVTKTGLMCINENCIGRNIQKLIHFSSREYMDIDGLGDSLANLLVENKLVKDFTDIYKLDGEDLKKLNLGPKIISNLLEAIDSSKGATLSVLLGSLGIPKAGKRVWSKVLVNVSDIFDMTKQELILIPGIGKVLASNIVDYIEANKNMIIELIDIIQPTESLQLSLKYLGRVFYLTGSFDKSRKLMEEDIVANGGTVSTTLNKNITDFLQGKNPTKRKVDKAKELNLNILVH